MNKLWLEFKPQIVFFSFMLVLFSVALNVSPVRKNTALVVPAETLEDSSVNIMIPDFGAITDIKTKKQAFFAFLQPYIDHENAYIANQRKALELIEAKLLSGINLSSADKAILVAVSKEYKLPISKTDSVEHLRQLLSRVDVIPSSLVLAQAANESAWGTSRFARHGNNFFGQWCYTKGCGLVPSQRNLEAKHEVKRFANPADSVHAYFMNLNTFSSYELLRQIRVELREQNNSIDGISLTEGLSRYSERGTAYIDELQSMIYSNRLMLRDEA